ncbi:MAG: cyanophycin synthetase [Planctomycetes bacterium]|nr:cyanophycin synthetase [Planctomycetota bacterium]
MEFRKVWILRGPNLWARVPVFEVECDLTGAPALETVPGFQDRLHSWLTLASDSFPTAAHALQHAALNLQLLAGSPVSFGLTRESAQPGLFRVVVEYEEEALGRACLDAARELCLAALHDQPFDAASKLGELRELAHDVRLGPSTAAIVRAARHRGIPARRLNEGSLVQLGQGVRARRICTAETDSTGAIAEAIAQDKELTRALLRAVGVPVPEGRPVSSAEDAWEAAEELGLPVVVKPQFGNHGRGVATNLTTREQVQKAYLAALEEDEHVLVETYAPGADHRLLVIGDRLVAAALREPAQVVGDGRSTITELVAEVNRDPRRSDGHATVLSFIKLDAVSLSVLAEQGYAPDSVPSQGQRVLIRRNGNLSTGGTATDVTDQVHPEVAARAVEAARAIGLDIAGVDVVVLDIGRPLEEQKAAVVEVNAGPGLRMHLEPSAGKPRPVGEAIVGMLFPDGHPGRIPIVAVTGVNGKTTTTRLIAHLLRSAGRHVGMTCTDGSYVNDRRIESRDCSGPRSARAVLLNPRVDAAVLETARGGILREGLGFDACDVAVVTNIGKGDHVGLRGIETIEELARVKRVVVEAVAPPGSPWRPPGGAAVLNAEDPLVAAMAVYCPASVLYFARDAGHPVVVAHRATGGRALLVRGGDIVLAEGEREEVLLALARVPLTHQGNVTFQVENVLAATGAAWALGLAPGALRTGLESFSGDARQVPGRFNVHRVRGATVVVDYAHNPSALAALVGALDCLSSEAGSRTIVFAAGNRRDHEIIEMGEIVGTAFDRVVLYADQDVNDRAGGELNALLRRGLAAGRRISETFETASEREAIATGFRDLRPGDLLVVGVEAIEEALACVQAHLDGTTLSTVPPSPSAEAVKRGKGMACPGPDCSR